MPQDPAILAVLRRQTKWFIDDDPFTITLTPVTKARVAGGGYQTTEGAPRAAQTVKLVYTGSARGVAGQEGSQVTQDGVEHRYDYVVIGEYNFEVAIGDTWRDARGNLCRITGLIPDNEYERRATASIFGQRVEGG